MIEFKTGALSNFGDKNFPNYKYFFKCYITVVDDVTLLFSLNKSKINLDLMSEVFSK